MAGPTFLNDLGFGLAAPGRVIDRFASDYDSVVDEDQEDEDEEDERLRRRL